MVTFCIKKNSLNYIAYFLFFASKSWLRGVDSVVLSCLTAPPAAECWSLLLTVDNWFKLVAAG